MKTNAKRAPVGSNSIFDRQAEAEAIDVKPKKRLKDGRVMVPFCIPPAARMQLRMMAIESDTTQQELLTLALNELFQRHGKPPIA